MAITINQQPTTPGIANSNLVFSVSSNQSTEPQFQYVVDIEDASNTLIQRVKQQPNPSEYGVFDFGQILPAQLGPTDRIWDTAVVAPNTASGADFKIYFGEEYGTSVSSSVTLYNGESATPGDPAKSGSGYYFMLDGFVNESALLNWNWASGSKYDEQNASDDVTFSHQNGLTTFSTQSIRLGDYHTISFLNGNLNGDPSTTAAQNVFAVTCKQYDSNDVQISSSVIYNETIYGSNPTGSLWVQVYTSQSEATRLVHFPAGPENWSDAGKPISSSCAYYTLTFNQQGTDGRELASAQYGEYRFNVTDANCGYSGVRFAWKNQYGVWDYYNFGLAESTTSTIERQSYDQSFVDYSSTTTSVPYNRERRGTTQYYNKVTKSRTAESDYLNQTDADNIRELFFSTDVYVQQSSGEWWPAVIDNATVTEKTNPRTQKLFKYTVEYKYANDQRPRR